MQASNFLKSLSKLSLAELDQIKGLGPVLAQNLIDFNQSERFQKLLVNFRKLEESGVNIEVSSLKAKTTITGKLSNETICITGTFDISRTEIASKLEELGAKVVDTVSKATTILLVGEKAGSKLEKAQKLGIKILSDYQQLL
ncbi:MAG: hypothetical protein OHK0017_01520 [Patescibacteria group bacterium]